MVTIGDTASETFAAHDKRTSELRFKAAKLYEELSKFNGTKKNFYDLPLYRQREYIAAVATIV